MYAVDQQSALVAVDCLQFDANRSTPSLNLLLTGRRAGVTAQRLLEGLTGVRAWPRRRVVLGLLDGGDAHRGL